MKPGPRACIAYIAGCLIAKKDASSLFDEAQNKHLWMSGTFGYDTVEVQDHECGCHVVGMRNGNDVALYHSGDEHKMSLQIKGNQFSGHDDGSNCGFNGTANGGSVRIYDYGAGAYFSYILTFAGN